MSSLKEECRRFYTENFDNLLKGIILEIEKDANNAKVVKETVDATALNLAEQEGVIRGAHKVLSYIDRHTK